MGGGGTVAEAAAGGGGARRAPTFGELAGYLRKCPEAPAKDPRGLACMLERFVEENEKPATSPHFSSDEPDRLDSLVRAVRQPALGRNDDLLLLVLKTFKILSRKQENRLKMGEGCVQALLASFAGTRNRRVAAEGANVILNVCYEKCNVGSVLECGGVAPLVRFLGMDSLTVKANAAGAIQSICFQEEGRVVARDAGAIPPVLGLLTCADAKVQSRAAGAIHNMSSDPSSIAQIRKLHGIPLLCDLLDLEDLSVAGSAAGALQNIAREVASRDILRKTDVAEPLARLLACNEIQVQVCAAGALLNIVGPGLGSEVKNNPKRANFGKLISLCMTLCLVYGAVFGENPSVSAPKAPEGDQSGFSLPGAADDTAKGKVGRKKGDWDVTNM